MSIRPQKNGSADGADQRQVRADRGAYAAGRDMTGNAFGDGSIVINWTSGAVTGKVPPPDYAHQVRQIAPAELLDRADELAELAAFCTADGDTAYGWWRAPAWSGKSALLATFVLHPPPGVQVISFFVTARHKGQDDRDAFSEHVLRQACALLCEELPPATDVTRDAAVLYALDRTAALCAARGERLVLVVDGLDEDRGVTAGPDAHSIAALLPRAPGHGMRVVVAGRPNPPVPDDVPHGHPLRRPWVERALSVSPHAARVREEATNELRRLLDDQDGQAPDTYGRKLLGLVAAAGGGLSGADLAELTGTRPWQVEEHLNTTTGRTFTTRTARWRADAPTVYVLAHDELQKEAEKRIRQAVMDKRRKRLHAWAKSYRAAGWPEDTPEYLLLGYPQLLRAAGDLKRMRALALDPARHARLYAASGSDALALGEIAAAVDTCLAQGDAVDLLAVLQLAHWREELRGRNRNVPWDIVECWALLGQDERARSVLTSASAEPSVRVSKLAHAGLRLARAGHHDRAAVFADEAHGLTPTMNGPLGQGPARFAAAAALAMTGRHETATAAARVIAGGEWKATALGTIARSLAEAGHHDQAAALAHEASAVADTLADPDQRSFARALVAPAFAAAHCFEQADKLVGTITDTELRALALGGIARWTARAGHHDRATALADQATALARTITGPGQQAPVLGRIAGALTEAGYHDRAAELTREATALAGTITDEGWRADVLTTIADALADAGSHDQAAEIAHRADALAHAATPQHEDILTAVARLFSQATAEDLTTVAAHTRTAPSPGLPAAIDRLIARADTHDRAAPAARPVIGPSELAETLTGIARVLAKAGDHDRATALAHEVTALGRTITQPWQARTDTGPVIRLALVLSEAGHHAQATALALHAAAVAGARPEATLWQDSELDSIALVLAHAGHHDQATAVAHTITDLEKRAGALAKVARIRDTAGPHDEPAGPAATTGTPQHGRPPRPSLVGENLRAGPWADALKDVGTVAPHVLPQFASWLIDSDALLQTTRWGDGRGRPGLG
ncbi:hypothetical protein [Streptomyces sp. NPDC058751]|uniref:hypothetical protein n=1 Tax=Streptomyces sp. NPDC058751 TaxID=3346623 RepID=UPI0036829634